MLRPREQRCHTLRSLGRFLAGVQPDSEEPLGTESPVGQYQHAWVEQRQQLHRDGRADLHRPRGGIVAEWSYLEVFRAARREALGEIDAATPLMGRPYDLRHAAVSTWLNAGVPAAQVDEWAGHSVDVLLRVYAKCIARAARRGQTAH